MKYLSYFENQDQAMSYDGQLGAPHVAYVEGGEQLLFAPYTEGVEEVKFKLENGQLTLQGEVDPVPEEPASPYQMVDLGLPSGLKWADRNVGASSPEDAGLYFQWGDTVGYTADQVGVDKVFNWDSYFDTTDGGSTFNKYNNNGGLTVLESVDDAATVHMGSQYRVPTKDEIKELINNTTLTFIDVNGTQYIKGKGSINIVKGDLKGVRFTGPNGNSIFIPAAGACNGSLLEKIGFSGVLWYSSLYDNSNASYWYFNYSGSIDEYSKGSNRYYGRSVRGVQP